MAAVEARKTEAQKKWELVFVLGQKGVLLPQDVAFKAEEVGFLWRKRSQNRQGWVEATCSQHCLSTGHPAADWAAHYLWNKVSLKALRGEYKGFKLFYGFSLHALKNSWHLFCRFSFPPMDLGCSEAWLSDSFKNEGDFFHSRVAL